MPIRARGFSTVTLLGRVLGGGARRIHTSADTIEHLTEEGLRDAADVVHALAQRLAGGKA